VPAEANEEHLRILAHLAKLFNETGLRKKLKTTRSAEEAYRVLTDWQF
jgi:mannitol/fructose-specific phosphotransferase system IIA component (Ntr-type)